VFHDNKTISKQCNQQQWNEAQQSENMKTKNKHHAMFSTNDVDMWKRAGLRLVIGYEQFDNSRETNDVAQPQWDSKFVKILTVP
jgi:hypothetical protein